MSLFTLLLLLSAVILYLACNILSNGPKPTWSNNHNDSKQSQKEESFEEAVVVESIPVDHNISYINKNCNNLNDFIINDTINAFDLQKLAQLNHIPLEIPAAWYPLAVQLVKDLGKNGWDKNVSCIKEKYANLRFYINGQQDEKLHQIIEHYMKQSEQVCMECGAPGEIREKNGWYYVACPAHLA